MCSYKILHYHVKWGFLNLSSYPICSISPICSPCSHQGSSAPTFEPLNSSETEEMHAAEHLHCACFSSGSFINVPHFPNTVIQTEKKSQLWAFVYLQTVHRNSVFFFINRNKHEKSIRKWKKHCELSQLQNVKNSKQPQGKKGTAWRVYLQIHCTYASNITKPASSGFTKGKYTLDAEIIHSKTQPCIKIRFHAAFTSQCNLEAEQQQLKETNGGRKNRNTGRASRHISGVLLSVSGYTTAHMTDLR